MEPHAFLCCLLKNRILKVRFLVKLYYLYCIESLVFNSYSLYNVLKCLIIKVSKYRPGLFCFKVRS